MIDGYSYTTEDKNKKTIFIFTDPDDNDNSAVSEVSDSEMEHATFSKLDLAYAKVQQELNEKRLFRLDNKTPLQSADEANEGTV